MKRFLPIVGHVLIFLALAFSCGAQGIPVVSRNGQSAYAPEMPFARVDAAQTNGVYNAAEWCDKRGHLDDSCLRNALAEARLKTPSRVFLPPGLYVFADNVTVTGLANVEIAGAGASTIIKRDATAFQCYSCTNVTFRDIAFTSVTEPVRKLIADLPTADPNQIVVIDRFSTNWGYIPTGNDHDLRVADGCSTHCLSDAQLAASFDNGVYFNGGSNIEISGLRGNFYSISIDGGTSVSIHNNTGRNGGKSNQGGCVTVGAGSERVRVVDNDFSYCSNAGFVFRGADTVSLVGNVAMYNGESGFKTGQNSPNYVTNFTSSSNVSAYNGFDGFDYAEDYPHLGTHVCQCASHGDISYSNLGVGFYLDGAHWAISGALVHENSKGGIVAKLSHSSITGSVIYANNTSHVGGNHQVNIDAGGYLTFTGNTIYDAGNGDYGVYAVDVTNQIYSGNTIQGAPTWDATNGHAISPF
ncbi:MAG: right-handed parallel beta-helix repeat-containing protein [Acidobacteria bacterium]|nr:right-handed parallel beta-helix repeat-containing protein [Acidobacteriota bacterium]